MPEPEIPFAELEFGMESDFRYDFTYTPGATDQAFTVVAHGDLDCDGVGSNSITMNANVSTAGQPQFAYTRINND